MINAVSKLTTLLLIRYEYDITTYINNKESSQLAEESITLAYEGLSDEPVWLDEAQAHRLLDVDPTGNVYREQALHFVKQVVAGYEGLMKHVEGCSQGPVLLTAHRRVRSACTDERCALQS